MQLDFSPGIGDPPVLSPECTSEYQGARVGSTLSSSWSQVGGDPRAAQALLEQCAASCSSPFPQCLSRVSGLIADRLT